MKYQSETESTITIQRRIGSNSVNTVLRSRQSHGKWQNVFCIELIRWRQSGRITGRNGPSGRTVWCHFFDRLGVACRTTSLDKRLPSEQKFGLLRRRHEGTTGMAMKSRPSLLSFSNWLVCYSQMGLSVWANWWIASIDLPAFRMDAADERNTSEIWHCSPCSRVLVLIPHKHLQLSMDISVSRIIAVTFYLNVTW